jgi:hypothetical protein
VLHSLLANGCPGKSIATVPILNIEAIAECTQISVVVSDEGQSLVQKFAQYIGL